MEQMLRKTCIDPVIPGALLDVCWRSVIIGHVSSRSRSSLTCEFRGDVSSLPGGRALGCASSRLSLGTAAHTTCQGMARRSGIVMSSAVREKVERVGVRVGVRGWRGRRESASFFLETLQDWKGKAWCGGNLCSCKCNFLVFFSF